MKRSYRKVNIDWSNKKQVRRYKLVWQRKWRSDPENKGYERMKTKLRYWQKKEIGGIAIS